MENNFEQHLLPSIEDTEVESEEQSDPKLTTDLSKCPFREQDIYLPIANVARIMKSAVPPSGKIAKDAKECVQECVSEFISFITSEASERCAQEKRKTINGEDVLFAMATLGFDPYIEPLKIYLQKYRDLCIHGTIQSNIGVNERQEKNCPKEKDETLKAEKVVGGYSDPQRTSIDEASPEMVQHPFTQSAFADLLDTSEDAGNAFSTEDSTIEQQIDFP